MAIYFHKTKKKWLVDVWFNGQRFKSGSFKIKALAEKFEREALAEIDQSKLTGVQFQDLCYNEIYQLWFESVSYRKRETSLVKDAQMHRDFVSPVIGQLKVNQIKAGSFEKIVANMLKQNLSKASVNKVIQHFKSVFNHSFNNETISRNPSRSFKQLKVETKEMDYFFQEELDEFLSHGNDKYKGHNRVIYVFYLTLFTTGMRLGEVLGLDWSCFDFQRNVIWVRQIWSRGKLIHSTKGKKDRQIPLPSMLKAELLLLRNISPGARVFSNDGILPLDPSNVRNRYWNKDMDATGLRRIRLHDARHTYGALFMMNGGNIYELSKVLGHTSIKTTERYAHLSNAHLAGVRDIIKPNLAQKAGVVKMNSLPIHCQEEKENLKSAVTI